MCPRRSRRSGLLLAQCWGARGAGTAEDRAAAHSYHISVFTGCSIAVISSLFGQKKHQTRSYLVLWIGLWLLLLLDYRQCLLLRPLVTDFNESVWVLLGLSNSQRVSAAHCMLFTFASRGVSVYMPQAK
jgi:hypothetical protein